MFLARHQVLCNGDVTIYMNTFLLPMTFHIANIALYMLSAFEYNGEDYFAIDVLNKVLTAESQDGEQTITMHTSLCTIID